ncbi:hypothetical protein J2X69_001297 [Algoriphagus sp. 4150]|nr:hypothetical protein [Algoriphagus sp. 4150]
MVAFFFASSAPYSWNSCNILVRFFGIHEICNGILCQFYPLDNGALCGFRLDVRVSFGSPTYVLTSLVFFNPLPI